MEAHLIRPAHFTGITCTAYQRREASSGIVGIEMAESAHEQQLRFRCSTGSHNTSLNNFLLKVKAEPTAISASLRHLLNLTFAVGFQHCLISVMFLFFFSRIQ